MTRVSAETLTTDDSVDKGNNASNVKCIKGENSCYFVSVFFNLVLTQPIDFYNFVNILYFVVLFIYYYTLIWYFGNNSFIVFAHSREK